MALYSNRGELFSSDRVNRLPLQVAIIVPSTRGDKTINQTAFKNRVEKTKRKLDSMFGGDTSIEGTGGWINEDDELVAEDVVKVESSTTPEKFQKKKSKFRDFIEKKRDSWKQDQLAYEYDGVTYLYPQKGYADNKPHRSSGSRIPRR